MRLFYDPTYNATGDSLETVSKAAFLAADLVSNPVPGVDIVSPTPATDGELLGVHDAEYVEAIRTGEPAYLTDGSGVSWDAGLDAAVRASTGGVRDAVLAALEGGANGGPSVAGSLSSGLHHARYESGFGFCTFNGLVVGARAALRAGAQRVLVLDLDAHCGGGTASLIEELGLTRVEQVDVSVHRFDAYRNIDRARLYMADGSDYLDVVEGALADIDDPGSIDLVIYNAGMDAHEGAGGVRGIDSATIARREEIVFSWAAGLGLPTAFVLAGGYLGPIDMQGLVGLHRLTIEAAAAATRALASPVG
jgi:acetoin utilization deacetylase AcuC-like enzyme